MTCNTPLDFKSEIVFHAGEGRWLMKMNGDGISFNRELFPESSPDDFALAFISIMEKNFKIKFEKKEPPYDK